MDKENANKRFLPIYEALDKGEIKQAIELVYLLEYEITEAYAFSPSADEFGEKVERILELA